MTCYIIEFVSNTALSSGTMETALGTNTPLITGSQLICGACVQFIFWDSDWEYPTGHLTHSMEEFRLAKTSGSSVGSSPCTAANKYPFPSFPPVTLSMGVVDFCSADLEGSLLIGGWYRIDLIKAPIKAGLNGKDLERGEIYLSHSLATFYHRTRYCHWSSKIRRNNF